MLSGYDSDTEDAGAGDSRVQGQPGVCYEDPVSTNQRKRKKAKPALNWSD